MIFVTVGNATQPFPRLLEAVDRLAGEGVFPGEAVHIQSGNNPGFRPAHCRQEAFLSLEQFEDMVQQADLIISHAGAGTLLQVLQAGKVPVVMPRRREYGEIIDEHQMELVKALAAEGRIVPAFSPEELPPAIQQARTSSGRPATGPSRMLALVAEAIEQLRRRS